MKNIKKMFFHNKRGIAIGTLVTMIIALVFLLLLLGVIVVIGDFTKNSWSTSMCRITLWTNAYVQIPVIHKEFVPIVCKSRPPHVITLSDVDKGSTDVDAIAYSIMKLVAEDQVATHYKVLGTSPDIEVFPKDDGIYCIFDRKISFDKKLQEYNGGKGIVTKGYLTYLMNSKMNDGKTTYAEYLYGYKPANQKTTFANEMIKQHSILTGQEETANLAVGMSKYDINISTAKEYYLIHYAIKGEKSLLYAILGSSSNQQLAKGVTDGIPGLIDALFNNHQKLTNFNYVIGALTILTPAATLALGSYNSYDNIEYNIRFTAIVPTDDVGFLRCTKIYGDDYGG